MESSNEGIVRWLQDNGLLKCHVECDRCHTLGKVQKRTSAIDGLVFRCTKGHEKSLRLTLPGIKFQGEIEIDESSFGRRVKQHRGRPLGMTVWVLGLDERATNRLILYPVEDRTADTLMKVIKRHVVTGSTIYTRWLGQLQQPVAI
ncbi:uncharacterized protein [Littorina saxatilis]|uniref:uncharacterized protein n=1 Tax=Littorina saxatilis TaxID=31220 RepID=UPI0038B561D2